MWAMTDSSSEPIASNERLMREYGIKHYIPCEDWEPLYKFVSNFRNCHYCRGLFYHSADNVAFFARMPFVCRHCATTSVPASDYQGIYLSTSVIVDGEFPSQWTEHCGCCGARFYVGKKPSRKTVATKSVSNETGIRRTMRVKPRTTSRRCDRCDGSNGPEKFPEDFGGAPPFTSKGGRRLK